MCLLSLRIKELKKQEKFESQAKPKCIQRGQFYWRLKENPRVGSCNLSGCLEEENGEGGKGTQLEARGHGGQW